MDGLVLLLVVVIGVIVLTPVADRIRVPQPVLLTIFGLVIALVAPANPLDLDPDLILPVVLPPLLFAATQRTTVTEFREHAGAVFTLAVGLTLATMGVAAVVAHAAGLPWPVAWVLGAIVSPPDPVAATAVARRLRLPHRLVTILEGEGMFNDATALVAYKMAVLAAVSGTITGGDIALELVEAVGLGVAVGLGLGLVSRLVLARIHDGYAETTVTVLVPFVAYVGAEHLNGSGVLAVLSLGLYLRTFGHDATTSGGWLLGRAVWGYADFLITSLVFTLLGVELVAVIRSTGTGGGTAGLALLVVVTLVVVRALWIYPTAWLARVRARRRDAPVPTGWRESTVVAWAGMRGVVTVATAVALPTVVEGGEPFPHREEVVTVALVAVLATLVVQGLTLGPVTKWLRVGSDVDERAEVASLRMRVTTAALAQIRDEAPDAGVDEDVRRAAVAQYEGYLTAQRAMREARAGEEGGARRGEALEAVLRRASDLERRLVLDVRRRGEVSAASADEVLRDIENRALRDFD